MGVTAGKRKREGRETATDAVGPTEAGLSDANSRTHVRV